MNQQFAWVDKLKKEQIVCYLPHQPQVHGCCAHPSSLDALSMHYRNGTTDNGADAAADAKAARRKRNVKHVVGSGCLRYYA